MSCLAWSLSEFVAARTCSSSVSSSIGSSRVSGKKVASYSVVPIIIGISADMAGCATRIWMAGQAGAIHDRAHSETVPLGLCAQLLPGHAPELFGIARAGSDHESLRRFRCRFRIFAFERGTAHDDCAVITSLSGWHSGQEADFATASGLPENRDAIRVAAEILDIGLHPVEGEHDIAHADIAGFGVFAAAELGQIQETESVEPVRNAHNDDILGRGQSIAVVEQPVSRATPEAAAMEPDHDRPLTAVGCRGEDVDV